jgi:hypothetical protein
MFKIGELSKKGGRYDEKNGLFLPCADAFLRFLQLRRKNDGGRKLSDRGEAIG